MKNNSLLRVSLLLLLCLALGLCLSACGEDVTCTVTFDPMNGEAATTVTLRQGEVPALPDAPARMGFSFGGWFTDEAGTATASPASTPVSADVTYYAGWEPLEAVRVSFDTNGGSRVAPITLIDGDALEAASVPTPTKEGYAFSGWYKNAACTVKYPFTSTPTESITLYAGWTLNEGMGEYIGMVDGQEIARSVFASDAPVLPGADDEVSYLWFSDVFLTRPYTTPAALTGTVTLYGMAYTEGLEIDGDTVTGYTGAASQVIVPPKWNGVALTEIGAFAFMNARVTSVKLPSTIEVIGESAFNACRSLAEINLTNACTSIGAYAFNQCEKLARVGDITGLETIPVHAFTGCKRLPSLTFSDSLLSVGEYAFADCKSMETVLLPDTVAEIGAYAFSGCSAITSFRIPSALNNLRTGALQGCTALKELIPATNNDVAIFRVIDGNLYSAYGSCLSLYVAGDKTETTFTLPQGCTTVAPFAFYGNTTLKSLALDAEAITLSKGSLAGMQALESLSIYALPSGANAYLAYYFGASSNTDNIASGNCTPSTLTRVSIASMGDTVPSYAFYGCTSLAEIEGLSETSLRAIGAYAFAYTALREVTIPATVQQIGENAFLGCNAIETFTVASANTAYAAFDGCLYSKDLTTLYLVPATKTSISFSSQLKTVKANAFYKSLARVVVLPSTVTAIEHGAFSGVVGLEELTVPFIGGTRGDDSCDYMIYIFGGTVAKTLQSDGSYEYRTAATSTTPTSLKKLTVSEPITAIGDFAFAYLTNVTEFHWTGDVTSIDDYAFCQTGLTELQVPNTVTRIGDYAFAAMSDLVSAVIPGSVGANLGSFLFSECSALETVVFEEGVKRIPAHAFYLQGSKNSETNITSYYSALDTVTLPTTLESIGEGAFAYAGTRYVGDIGSTYGNLKFILPAASKLRVIEKRAFYCASVKSLALPACFEEVGELAFFGCLNLTDITFGTRADGSALQKFGGACFAFCRKLASVTIWKTVEAPDDLPAIEYYTLTTTTETASYNIFAGLRLAPQIYVRSAALYQQAPYWNEYNDRILEVAETSL